MKVKLTLFLLTTTLALLFLLCPGVNSYAQSAGGVKTIVIDAGHGGRDPGTVWKDFKEKDINLSVALMLGEMIKKNLPDVKVVYTRSTDVFIELSKRSEIANKANADLFLSIHVNAVDPGVKPPSGALTLVMGANHAGANLDVAMRENDVILYEEDYSTTYEGYKPGSTESFIMFSLLQFVNIDQSMSFANMLQKHYKSSTPMPDKGVRQQPILVLWKTAMPAVLTELGFLNNETDRKTLTSKQGQQVLATALFNAFSEYKSKVEGKTGSVQLETLAGGSNASEQTAASSTGKIVYHIQICSANKKIPKNSSTFKDYRGQVKEVKVGSVYKYFVGECVNYNDALELQKQVRKIFPDAFMVCFEGDKQITVSDARRITG